MSTILCKELLQVIASTFNMYLYRDLVSSRSVSKACINITLYDELFYHLHNREIFPQSSKDNFDRCQVIYSQITIVLPCQNHAKVYNRSGTWHSILYRTYDLGIGNDFSFSFYFLPWSGFKSLLNFRPCNTCKNSFFDCSILNYFKILSRYVLIEKSYQAS